MPKLEIIAIDAEDAHQAQIGGANSVELVADMSVGGLTPTLETIQAVRDAIQINLYVMLRPHARDFVYSPAEMDTLLADLAQMRSLGINGIVFGSLQADGQLNVEQLQTVLAACGDLRLTFHRAIDVCSQPEVALDSLQHLVTRVLSSGGANSIDEGQARFKTWLQTYGERIDFVCGAGIRLDNIQHLAATLPAPEFHVGSAARRDGRVEAELVRQFRAIIDL